MIRNIFFFLSALALFSAVMTVFSRNLVHSILFLILCFFAIAGHYLLLNAQFLAVVSIIVYAGAIMVLFLFTLMLLNLNLANELNKSILARITAVIAGGLLLVALVGVLRGLDTSSAPQVVNTQIGLAKNLGRVLYQEYMFPFEVASVLFLAAMVGAVMMVKTENQ
jgi:NADH-quinone oxidoreductase subunit J